MQLILTQSFQRDARHLDAEQKAQLFTVILKLPTAVRDIHRHSGIGLRKIHSSGVYAARLGLGLRIVFGYKSNSLYLHRVGDHDEIRRYLKKL